MTAWLRSRGSRSFASTSPGRSRAEASRMKQRLLVATGNRGKLREIGAALRGLPYEVVGLDDVLPGASYPERGRTFRANARGKALFYALASGLLVLADDSGLEVDALEGRPGVRSARFAPPRPDDERNNRKLLSLLEGVPAARRKARFVCVLALARDGRVLAEVRGEVRGRITREPRGSGGFGYDPVFFYPPLRRTFGELSPEEKSAVSHRGRALRKLRRVIARGRPPD